MTSKALFIVFPVTLFEDTTRIAIDKHIVVVEHPVYFGSIGKERYSFSKPKLMYTKACLLAFCAHLRRSRKDFTYVTLSDYQRFRSTLKTHDVFFNDPVDKVVVRDLTDAAKTCTISEAPNFLISEADMQCYVDRKTRRNYFHKHFYEWQRKRTGILMQNGKPIGGKYSYDPANRKPLPSGHRAPLPPSLTKEDNLFLKQATKWVATNFPDNPGILSEEALRFPVTYKGSRIWLKQFLADRLHLFGRYEDAIARSQPLLYHSGCSPMLLVGLVTPQQILRELLKYQKAPIEAVEGYYRQLVWREFVRLLYVYESDSMWKNNYLKANRKLKKCWYDGTTGIPIVDDTIKDAFSNGYLHHIQRLMIIGNIMLLCAVHPHEIFKWFLEFAVDSNQYIMYMNCIEMISFASGGLCTTKPYCSSFNYLERMSDYPKGPWSDIWNALYHSFWRKNYPKLKKVRQAHFAIGNIRRKSKADQAKMQSIAERFIRSTTIAFRPKEQS